MAFGITEVEVWEGEIEGCAGAVSEQLAEVFRAGANLDVMISRPCPVSANVRPSCMSAIRHWLSGSRPRESVPGTSTLFLAPLRGEAQTRAATKAGLRRSTERWLRLEGPDRPWLAAGIARTLADAEIKMRSLTAAVLGERAVLYLSFESEADARRARQALAPVLD
ncbi:MAG: hypothetical protein ABIG44_05840 [Planctomycetota bacterium]